MAIDRATFLEIVKDAYSAYYTILPAEEGEEELPLAFRAEYKGTSLSGRCSRRSNPTSSTSTPTARSS